MGEFMTKRNAYREHVIVCRITVEVYVYQWDGQMSFTLGGALQCVACALKNVMTKGHTNAIEQVSNTMPWH